MRTDRVDQLNLSRRRRSLVVLGVLCVVTVGIVAKRLITPGRVVAQSVAKPDAPQTRRVMVAMPPVGLFPVAKVERDPFAILIDEAESGTTASLVDGGFAVSGIMRGRVSFATINGRRYREGETVDGVRLERVEVDGVILLVNGRQIRVGIDP